MSVLSLALKLAGDCPNGTPLGNVPGDSWAALSLMIHRPALSRWDSWGRAMVALLITH
jgi:hypothetical protein